MSDPVYQYLGCHEDPWFCFCCSLPQFYDLYFNAEESIASIDLNTSSTSLSSILQKSGRAPLQECKSSALFCHLNAQILLPKMGELRDTLTNAKCPIILGISETWLDGSVLNGMVRIHSYTLHRHDRGSRGGGVLVYVPQMCSSRQRADLEDDVTEAV